MKIIILISLFFFLIFSSFGKTYELQTNSKTFQIHKTKRPFVNKNDRLYLKKKDVVVINSQKTVEGLLESGIQKEKVNDYKGALANFESALLIEPNNSKVLYYSGFVKYQMEDYANAIADYNVALESDSESVELYYCRGNAKFELTFFKEAISDYNKAILLDSTDSQSYFNRAISKYNINQLASSCKDLQLALKYADIEAEVILKEVCH